MIVITTLAEYQTRFWLKVAKELQKKGERVILLSFDDRSSELLDSHGLESYNIPKLAKKHNEFLPENFKQIVESYGIDDIYHWISHERITFSLSNSNELILRLIRYLHVADELFSNFKNDSDDITLVQELGGFISVIASFFAAKNNGIDNVFLEPSFFRGRFVPLVNSFKAPDIRYLEDSKISDDVKNILQSTIDSQSIVIPKKDSHQYKGAYLKIFNLRNIKRVLEKFVDKYFLNKHQEFGYLGSYLALHIRMFLNSLRMRMRYTPLDRLSEFIYFPFHVPADMALTIRSPEYFDQLSLVEYLLKIVPFPYMVAVKEHPAQIGAIDATRLRNLMKKYDNLVVINPGTNNYSLLNKCKLLVSINSKTGAEAAMLKKPTIVLGDAFYKNSPLVEKVSSLADLKIKIIDSLNNREHPHQSIVDRYFQNIWDKTFLGELYVEGEKDIQNFSNSISQIVKSLEDIS